MNDRCPPISKDSPLSMQIREGKQTEDRRRKIIKRSKDVLEGALAAAAHNDRPDVGDSDDLDVVDIVDPSEEAEMERVGRGPPMMRRRKNVPTQRRVISIRDDAVGRMAKRGQLGNSIEREIRLKAARYYESLYERAEIGGARGIDPSKDVVDGGGFAEPDTEARLVAQERLGKLDRQLGATDAEIVRAVLVHKMTLEAFAHSRDRMLKRHTFYYNLRFADTLDAIAKLAGFTQRPNRAPRHDDEHAVLADASANAALHAAVQRARSGIELFPKKRVTAAAD